MRAATLVSVGAHAVLLAVLLGFAMGESAPAPEPPKAIAVSLAPPAPVAKPEPTPKPVPVETPKPAPTPPKPVAKPAPKPAATKPAPAAPAPALVASAPATASEPAEASAPAAPPAPPASPAPAAATPDARWLAVIRARLDAAKRYPPAALRRRDEGTATITMVVGRDGQVLSSSLSKSSGSSLLDREAESLPERVSLPPMPETMTQERITIVVPVSFALR